jgi:hypothetical protein
MPKIDPSAIDPLMATDAEVAAAVAPIKFYDMSGGFPGNGVDGEDVDVRIIPRVMVLQTGGHFGYAKTPGTGGTASYTIKRVDNTGALIATLGTMDFAAGSKAPTFSVGSSLSQRTFAAGDLLVVTGPTPANPALADVAFTLNGGV